MASRGSRGQTVASAREGHLSGAGSRDLGVGELSCTNGFGKEERSGSCARSTGGQRRALTRPRRGLRGSLVLSCAQMDLFTRGEVGMERAKPTLPRREGSTSAAHEQRGAMPGLGPSPPARQSEAVLSPALMKGTKGF